MYGDCENEIRLSLPPCLVVQWFQQQPRDFRPIHASAPMGIVFKILLRPNQSQKWFYFNGPRNRDRQSLSSPVARLRNADLNEAMLFLQM
jgi:hypothetical protein